ncbi:hypothetical protein B4113_2316 [Geobacillus sp. B4113_201601]|nr:hypothetical protein B4113_2316 [Geobacillus sp. B4113_201601]
MFLYNIFANQNHQNSKNIVLNFHCRHIHINVAADGNNFNNIFSKKFVFRARN